MSIKIVSGFRNYNYINTDKVNIDSIDEYLQKNSYSYEVLNIHDNRIYFDIDGNFKNIIITETEFNERNIETLNIIQGLFKKTRMVILTASSYEYKKISFRVILPQLRMRKHDNELLALQLTTDHPLPIGVIYDPLVYRMNQKMRLVYSTKDEEIRPLVKINPIDDTRDCVISYILNSKRTRFNGKEPEYISYVE
jgi:hypothetical protein